jgi:SHS2 domain-containing protein
MKGVKGMPERKVFEFLEHTADIYIAAYGKTLEEAFENAALSMFEVMTETEKIEEKIIDIVEVRAEDEYSLLYLWLESLLIKFEVEEKLYSKFKVSIMEKNSTHFILKAEVIGERFNPEKHPSKVGIKAVTYHQMEIIQKNEGRIVKFIIDV